MLWSFLAVFFSGWLYVDASYRGPHWQRLLFKPLTLLLMIGMVWQTPTIGVPGYFVLLALTATLIGDALVSLPEERLRWGLMAYALAHLFYTLTLFSSSLTLGFSSPLSLTLVLLASLLLTLLWRKLGRERLAVITLIIMTALMVWTAGERYVWLANEANLSLLSGAVLLFAAHAIWLVNHFRFPFRAHRALVAISYFGGHFLMVHSLYS